MSDHLVVRLRVTSVRSRGRNGGVIFTGRKEGGGHCAVVCSYDLVPESSVVQKGQLWQIEGSSQPRTFEVNGFRRTEQQIDASSAELLSLGNTNLIDWIAKSGCAGIGPAKATRLLERFGESLVENIRRCNVDLLAEVVSEESARALCYAFEQHKIADTLLWLDRIGVDRRMGRRIAEFYGESACSKIEANPYVLISFASTWSRVDELARSKFKVDAAAPCRLAGAVEEVLYGAFENGHTCLPRRAFKARLEDLLKDERLAKAAMDIAASSPDYVFAGGNFQSGGAYVIEHAVATRLLAMSVGEVAIGQQPLLGLSGKSKSDLGASIAAFEQELGDKLTEQQRRAIELGATSELSLILGGAGTGKTTVLKALYSALEATRDGVAIYQMALSGMAAQRMAELTGRQSMTIAAFLLRVDPATLSSDCVVVVDEMSMVDVILMYRLLNHLPPGVRLILVGDPSQLAPIGPGLVLHALAGHPKVLQTELIQVKRQSAESGIPLVARDVRAHQKPTFAEYLGKGAGVSFVQCSNQMLEERALDIYAELGGAGQDFSVQILSITKSNLGSSKNLNTAIHAKYRSSADRINYFDSQYGIVGAATLDSIPIVVGDLIMYGKTDEEFDLRNGSLGKVIAALPVIDEESEVCICDFGGRVRRLRTSHLLNVRHAYAITVHKSQGSQFKRVILPVRKSPLLDQSLIYTAITRGVEQVVLVGDMGAALAAIKGPSKAGRRFVNLPSLLSQGGLAAPELG